MAGAPVASAAAAKVGRFAPSPTGRLHAGNIFAYLVAWLDAKSSGGTVVLRIEDLDVQRSKREYADALMRDLERLGLTWDVGPFWQSERHEAYAAAFQALQAADAVYPCFCTRAEAALSAPHGEESGGYAGTCRSLSAQEREQRTDALAAQGRKPSYRLKMPDGPVRFRDAFQGLVEDRSRAGVDDPPIRRADGLFAYQLAVVVDDAEESVTSVVRGCDLLPSVKRQLRIIELLGYDEPAYGHIPLLIAPDGRRLSKRDGDASIDAMCAALGSPEAVIGHIAHLTGISAADEPTTPEKLLSVYDEKRLRVLYEGRRCIPFSLDQSATIAPLANTQSA